MKRIASTVLSIVLCTSVLTAFALDWPTGRGAQGGDQGSAESGTAGDGGSRTASRRPWGQIPWEEQPYPDSGKSFGYPGRGYPPSGEGRSWDSRPPEPPREEPWSFGSQHYHERDYEAWSQGSDYSPYGREVMPREPPSYRVPRYGEPLSYRDGDYDRGPRDYRRYRGSDGGGDRNADYYAYPGREPWGDPRAYRAPPRREPWSYGGGYYDRGPGDYSGYGGGDWGGYGGGDRDADYYAYPGREPWGDPRAYRAPWWEPGYHGDRYYDGPGLDPWDSYRSWRWDPWLRDPALLDGGPFYDSYLW